MATLLTHVRNYLISEGLVRKPSVAGAAPPLWIEPADGVPAAGEGDNSTEVGATIVLGMTQETGIPRAPFDGQWLRTDAVQFVFRVSSAGAALSDAFDFETQLKRRLDDRRAWDMAGLLVLESRMFRALQRIDSSRAQGYTLTTEYTIERTNPLPPMP